MDVSLLQRVLATAGARDRSDVAMILVHTRLAQLHFISVRWVLTYEGKACQRLGGGQHNVVGE